MSGHEITQQGSVTIERVDLIIDHDDVKIWDIQTEQKRPEVITFLDKPDPLNGGTDSLQIWLRVGWPIARDETKLRIPVDRLDRWCVIADPDRYGTRIVTYFDQRRDKWSPQ